MDEKIMADLPKEIINKIWDPIWDERPFFNFTFITLSLSDAREQDAILNFELNSEVFDFFSKNHLDNDFV